MKTKPSMLLLVLSICFLFLLHSGFSGSPMEARGADLQIGGEAITSVVKVSSRENVNDELKSPRQIIRSSSGRIYYFYGNDGHTGFWDGLVNVYSSADGNAWTNESSHDEWYAHSGIGLGLDSTDTVHMITYNWSLQPYYQKFNTMDSPKGDHTRLE